MNKLFCSRCQESYEYIIPEGIISVGKYIEKYHKGEVKDGLLVPRRMTVFNGQMYCDQCWNELS